MRKISIITLVLAVVMIANQSCTKTYFDINKDPNNITSGTVTYDVVLPAALSTSGSIIATQWGFLQNWMGYWARSGSYSANSVEETYNITTSFGTGIWSNLLDNNYDYQVIIGKAKTAGAGFYEGVARIMRAHNTALLVDLYNNVPYTQAGQGASGNITPSYDNGLTVYKDLFRQLDTAISLIKVASTTGPNKGITENDIMFKGNNALWVKFANTLKLRMIIHMHKVPTTEFDRASEVAKIVAEGSGYLGAGENAAVNPGYAADKPNPFYNTFIKDAAGNATGNNRYYAANKWAMEYYKWNGDLRKNYFYAPVGGTGTTYTGVDYGLPPSTTNAYTSLSLIGAGLGKSPTMSQWILTGTESLFLQAEAAQRGFITGTAATLLSSAIAESFSWLGVPTTTQTASGYLSFNATYTDCDISAAAAPASATATATGDKNFTILSQKMFALNGIAPFEIFTDWRRTDIIYGTGNAGYTPGPALSVSPAVGSNKIPTRLFYPQNEYNYNAAAVAAQGTITAQTKIFWDR